MLLSRRSLHGDVGCTKDGPLGVRPRGPAAPRWWRSGCARTGHRLGSAVHHSPPSIPFRTGRQREYRHHELLTLGSGQAVNSAGVVVLRGATGSGFSLPVSSGEFIHDWPVHPQSSLWVVPTDATIKTPPGRGVLGLTPQSLGLWRPRIDGVDERGPGTAPPGPARLSPWFYLRLWPASRSARGCPARRPSGLSPSSSPRPQPRCCRRCPCRWCANTRTPAPGRVR